MASASISGQGEEGGGAGNNTQIFLVPHSLSASWRPRAFFTRIKEALKRSLADPKLRPDQTGNVWTQTVPGRLYLSQTAVPIRTPTRSPLPPPRPPALVFCLVMAPIAYRRVPGVTATAEAGLSNSPSLEKNTGPHLL
ncbi:hypothetical protein PoB_002446200 [Plakobranchus ocellatus]|uniref:Uncharacterized protein n=1 Tax=Plakobranchus ocellatus TaxID=259542 RepID=A0AAV3ZTS6_9GAST|nr:hypothetical protein PoB_002446200 [Plakobranchus ocellatus]